MKKLNLSTILLALGLVAQFGPDVAAVSAWLTGLGVAWLVWPAKILGAVALTLSALPLVIKRLRPVLALLGLATPPGAPAPWIPGRPGDPALTVNRCLPCGHDFHGMAICNDCQASHGPCENTSVTAPVAATFAPAAPLPSTETTPVTVPLRVVPK